jgi:hypothetical protein
MTSWSGFERWSERPRAEFSGVTGTILLRLLVMRKFTDVDDGAVQWSPDHDVTVIEIERLLLWTGTRDCVSDRVYLNLLERHVCLLARDDRSF